jgi:hypothetical protein
VPETYAEQLERVQSTIAKIEEAGQTQDINGRRLTRADLGVLYAREKWLRKMVDREDRGGIRMRRAVPRG